MKEILLLKYGEIVLKGANKKYFEDMLCRQLRRKAKAHGNFEIYRSQSTIYVQPKDDFCDMDGMMAAAGKVFGIVAICRAAVCEKNMESILETVKTYIPPHLEGKKTFKVESKRSDKAFPLDSMEISREAGGAILSACPRMRVDVHNPDVTVRVEVREFGAYVHPGPVKGAGGMPVGSNGRGLLLLSGGIDSPVAGYMMAKRGMTMEAIHFESFPYTSELARDKVLRLAQIVSEYNNDEMIVHVVSLTPIQEELVKACDEDYFTLLLRRYMMAIADRVAHRFACGALVTGESVKTAVQMGMSLAQIGEFAFMVAILYFTVTGDTSSPMFNIVVAASVLTTLVNPMLIRASVPAGEWVEAHLPARFRSWSDAYRQIVAKYHQSDGEVRLHHIVRMCLTQIGVLLALNFAVAVVCMLLNGHDWSNFSVVFNNHKRFVFCLAVNLFIVAMVAPAVKIAFRLAAAVSDALVGGGSATWQQAVRHIVSLIVLVVVAVLFFAEMTMINVNLSPESLWARWLIRAILLAAGIFGWRFFVKAGHKAAQRFEEALTAEERREKIGAMLTLSVPESSIHRLVLTSDSPAVGATVVTLNIRAKTGASVVEVMRGGETIRNIGPETEFCIGDVLTVLGDGQQVAALKDLLGITS